jgi:hypothetical protein
MTNITDSWERWQDHWREEERRKAAVSLRCPRCKAWPKMGCIGRHPLSGRKEYWHAYAHLCQERKALAALITD